MARRRPRPHYYVNIGLSLLVLGVFALTGMRVAGNTSAATANPYGFADYCALESNTTVIYGWAADPNSTSLTSPQVTITAGGQAQTVDTNRAGYRDAQINAWIDQNRAGDPEPGTYGFRAVFSGLMRGNQYTITGTALNDGPGSSVILNINNSGYTDGDTSKPYFAGNVIPQSCLASTATAPAPAPPPPAPSSGSTKKPAPSPAPSVSPSTSASNAADGSVVAGTLAATVTVPAGGAQMVHLIYGTNPVALDQTTPDQTFDISGSSTDIHLAGLDPDQSYTYQIVRTDGAGKTATSAPANFTTLGFIIAIHFVDNQDKGVQGIKAQIDHQPAVQSSDNSGTVLFKDIPGGGHTVTYIFKNKQYRKDISASAATVSPAQAALSQVITLDNTVNLQNANQPSVASGKKGTSLLGILIPAIVAVLAIILAVIGYTRRRQNQSYQDYYESIPMGSSPLYEAPPAIPEPAVRPPRPEDTSGLNHIGESLKDMVLRSMAEEAKNREAGARHDHQDHPDR